MNLDEIKSYNAFKTEVSNKIRSEFPGTELHIQECTDHMLIYKLSDGLDVTLNPKINFAMRILQDLSIKMWISNVEIQSQQLKWILGHTGDKLTLWSQLFEMCRRYQDVPEPDMESRCKYLVNILKAFGNDIEHEVTFNFLAEQCQLFTTSPKGRRYSVDTLILSFTYFHKSNACYSELQKMFCVPSKRTLRKISSNLSDHSGIQCETYLKQKVTLLQPHELLVNLMIDEIHIKGVVERFITGHEECTDVHSICDSCGVTHLNIIMKSLGCFANTLLNNYSKNKCDDISTSKVSRKVAKFN